MIHQLYLMLFLLACAGVLFGAYRLGRYHEKIQHRRSIKRRRVAKVEKPLPDLRKAQYHPFKQD